MPIPFRRAADLRPPVHPDPRLTLSPGAQSDHMRGWVAYAMHQPLPAGANADLCAGYAEAARQLDGRMLS